MLEVLGSLICMVGSMYNPNRKNGYLFLVYSVICLFVRVDL